MEDGHLPAFKATLAKYRPELAAYEELYKDFHRNPEISTLESETSATIAAHLRRLSPDLDIRTGIGGYGLVAICRNGSGPTILLRADMDGLPVHESTGLDYASTKTMLDTNLDNKMKPTMHACGHDFHMSTQPRAKSEWAGTIVFLYQPSEERGTGAQSMIEDGLFDPDKHACPIPDVLLGQHVGPMKGGTVTTKVGPIASASDNWRITVFGKGGHASMPHFCVDPVVLAAHIVVKIQTIVSREIPPGQLAVMTVGSLQAGETVNVISDKAVLMINMRSSNEHWRSVMIDSLKRIVKAECEAAKSPKPPDFELLDSYPVTFNDEKASRILEESFVSYFGDDFIELGSMISGSEDFQVLATAVDKPSVFWGFGGTDPAAFEKYKKDGTLGRIAVNHSAGFAPAISPTLQTGLDAMVVAALTFVGK